MPSPEILKDLLERVRKAGGGDHLLEFAIFQAVGGSPKGNPYCVTRSLDACLSLLGEVLPGWAVNLSLEHPTSSASIHGPTNSQNFRRNNSCATLALLDCILQALLSQHSIKE